MSLTQGDGELVSVILPTYYRNNTLQEAIESVYRQEHRPIELIVVDDSGEAHAEPALAEYEDPTYVPLDENVGAQGARNVGLERASGEYVQFLDDDDVLREDKFAKQIPLFSDSVGVVYSALEILETGEVIRPKPDIHGDVLKDALLHTLWPCSNCTMLMDYDVLQEILPIEHLHAADDVGIQIELARRTEFDFVDEPLIYSRDSVEDSLSSSPEYIESRLNLISEYSALYERHPDSVKRRVLSGTYRAKAERQMERTNWSLEAIIAYGKSAYYAQIDRPMKVVDFVLSILGNPGLRLARHLRNFVSKHFA